MAGRRSIHAVTTGAISAVALLGLVAGAEAAAPSRPATPTSDRSSSQILYGVSALSSTDVWAVGYETVRLSTRTLVEHWDGRTWTQVPSPSPGRRPQADDTLSGVDARSASDVWAVGQYVAEDGGSKTLVEHWNGRVWTVVPSPNPGSGLAGGVAAVTALSAHDVWAVGQYETATHTYPALALHWDGRAWHQVRTPVVPGGTSVALQGVASSSPDDAWAVGEQRADGDGAYRSVVEHWNGTRWALVRDADAFPLQTLTGVAAIAPDDVWAVGGRGQDSFKRTFTEHWDGTRWSLVASANLPGYASDFLESVSGSSPSDVWAVGYHGFAEGKPLIEHWNGTAWTIVPGPDVHRSDLLGVVAITGRDAWAVGGYGTSQVRVLRTHWDGSSWGR